MKDLLEKIKLTYGDIAKVVNNTIMLFNNTKVLVIDKVGNNNYSWYVRYQNKFLTNNNLSSLEQMINLVIRIFME